LNLVIYLEQCLPTLVENFSIRQIYIAQSIIVIAVMGMKLIQIGGGGTPSSIFGQLFPTNNDIIVRRIYDIRIIKNVVIFCLEEDCDPDSHTFSGTYCLANNSSAPTS
jgi:hypothetical protein